MLATRFLLPGTHSFDWDDIAERASVSPAFVKRLWRALGFPDPPDSRPFTDADLEALESATRLVGGSITPEVVLRQARIVSPSIGRIAELFVDELAAWRDQGMSDAEILSQVAARFDMQRLERVLGYVLRRQLCTALVRRFGASTRSEQGTQELAIAFIDLVGFTALAQRYDARTVAELAGRFESIAFDAIAEMGGRFVKVVGDEVMFSADSPPGALAIAVRLIEDLARDPDMPSARAGLAWGPVVPREGDYFGGVVNLASRVMAAADHDCVVASAAFHRALAPPENEWQALGHVPLKGIGEVELWQLGPLEAGSRLP